MVTPVIVKSPTPAPVDNVMVNPSPITTLSLMVMSCPAVVIPALSVVVAPEPSIVIEALSAPVSALLTVILPAPAGARIVTGSLKVIAAMVIAPVPAAAPMVIELNPLARVAISAAVRSRAPVPPAPAISIF